ncbi:MAG: DNA-3-methyladenine glycosylase family protein [Coriobacteriia bacterium]
MPGALSYDLDSPEVVHLSAADAVLGDLIARVGPLTQTLETDHYSSLASAIVSQQLSDKAASTIWGRLVTALGGDVAPEHVLAADDATLRGAGLSGSKTAFLRDLAAHVSDGRLDLARVSTLPDDDVIAELTAVKGIGRWTAEMFLIFALGRPDVLAVDDGALRSTVAWLYGLDNADSREPIAAIGEAWRPYRTCASLYLWRGLALRRAEERAARS